MPFAMRTTAAVGGLALLAVACQEPGSQTVDLLGDAPEEDVLSSCEPAGNQDTSMLVEPSDQLPPTITMEQAVDGHLDAEFMIEQLEAEGQSREDALHAMYAQVVGEQLFADAWQLPGFVTGANAQPLHEEPFHLSFSGELPEEFDPDDYDLDSFGLKVTTGAAGLDHQAMAAAHEAAREVGMQVVSGWGDETTGTARIEVVDATPEQVAEWEETVEDPSRWCLIRAARTVACDDSVIAEADERAARQGEVLPNEQGAGEPTAERAEEVGRSYLGLTLDEARDKAEQEDRPVRVVVQDGVPLGQTDDLVPGRLSFTVCDGVVVDTRMDAEPEG